MVPVNSRGGVRWEVREVSVWHPWGVRGESVGSLWGVRGQSVGYA